MAGCSVYLRRHLKRGPANMRFSGTCAARVRSVTTGSMAALLVLASCLPLLAAASAQVGSADETVSGAAAQKKNITCTLLDGGGVECNGTVYTKSMAPEVSA